MKQDNMQRKKIKIKKSAKIFFLALLALITISFVNKKQNTKICSEITVNISNQLNNDFINENDVIQLLTQSGKDYLIGKRFKDIYIKQLEERLKTNRFVESCQISKNLKGELVVEIEQVKPMARVLTQEGDFYVDAKGKTFLVSDKFTARVMTINVENQKDIPDFQQNEEAKKLLELVKFIHQDPFWNVQITGLNIDKQAEVTLYLQVGKQTVAFGKCEEIEEKFKKLKILYKKILPVRGWNTYSKVSLKYQNQIICE